MEKKKADIQKVKQALSIKAMAECVPVIGGGIVLIILVYPFWGTLCMLAGMLGIFTEITHKSHPKPSRAMNCAKLLLETVALIAGGVTLILLGQVGGGVACICVCAQRAVMSLFVMPVVEKKYLTAS
ncbi:MAG: hypothetical protein LBN26_00230 [Christensenellaceae bacterium]|jgi:hypothetical protein|nr:hypothetical protein [Christensenellaceae bacterium]